MMKNAIDIIAKNKHHMVNALPEKACHHDFTVAALGHLDRMERRGPIWN
jgi:hypothetical protein